MTCYSPIEGFWSKDLNEQGNRYIVFNHRDGYHDAPIRLPCGRCIGCRLEYSRWWALRCVNEASLYQQNSFITLTYNDKNIPPGGTLVKRDLQLFFKRLRKEVGKSDNGKIRYFACGEYGDNTHRPHYHAILFNYSPTDKTILRTSRFKRKFGENVTGDNVLYTSQIVHDLWQQKGYISIGSVGFESAGYVARYTVKKIVGDMAKKIYGAREPPFALMSRRPGIGHDWIKKYESDIYAKDYLHLNGKKIRPCRYYDNILKESNPKRWKEIKEKRASDDNKGPIDVPENLRKAHCKYLKNKQQLKRSLHDD